MIYVRAWIIPVSNLHSLNQWQERGNGKEENRQLISSPFSNTKISCTEKYMQSGTSGDCSVVVHEHSSHHPILTASCLITTAPMLTRWHTTALMPEWYQTYTVKYQHVDGRHVPKAEAPWLCLALCQAEDPDLGLFRLQWGGGSKWLGKSCEICYILKHTSLGYHEVYRFVTKNYYWCVGLNSTAYKGTPHSSIKQNSPEAITIYSSFLSWLFSKVVLVRSPAPVSASRTPSRGTEAEPSGSAKNLC